MTHVTAIVDLQFGSTGKGLLAGMLSQRNNYDLVVSANMPNAGHTFVDPEGRAWVNKVLPSGVYSGGLKFVCIGPGAVFDPDQLKKEFADLRSRGIEAQLVIHAYASLLLPEHKAAEEAALSGIGSTMQGSMEAMVHKLRRPTDPAKSPTAAMNLPALGSLADCVVTPAQWVKMMRKAKNILVEGSQGYSLGINAGFYPYCTSRDCTVWRLLADCAVSPTEQLRVIGSARLHPIRVGNTSDGWSGPCYDDQQETTWDEIGVSPEYTTVTKRQRRVFTFSKKQIEEAIWANRVDEVFLNFCNYDPVSIPAVVGQINEIGRRFGKERGYGEWHSQSPMVRYLGFGPSGDDVLDTQNVVTTDEPF